MNKDTPTPEWAKYIDSAGINPNLSALGSLLSGTNKLPTSIPKFMSVDPFQRRKDLYYRKKEIKIDGYIFENCRFDNCKLITSRGSFKFINCVLDDFTFVTYEKGASKIIKLYNRRKQVATAALNPINNQDGTITIE